MLRQLGDHADAVRRREFEALFAARRSLTEADREAIAHMMSRLQNQLLHQPRAALRSAASEPATEHPHPLLNAVRHLFGLADI